MSSAQFLEDSLGVCITDCPLEMNFITGQVGGWVGEQHTREKSGELHVEMEIFEENRDFEKETKPSCYLIDRSRSLASLRRVSRDNDPEV